MRIKINWAPVARLWDVDMESRTVEQEVNLQHFGAECVAERLKLAPGTFTSIVMAQHFALVNEDKHLIAKYACVLDESTNIADRAYVM